MTAGVIVVRIIHVLIVFHANSACCLRVMIISMFIVISDTILKHLIYRQQLVVRNWRSFLSFSESGENTVHLMTIHHNLAISCLRF